MITCKGCGTEIHESAKVCPSCGCDRRHEIKTNSFSVWVYAAFIFFLYPFGLHYVYVRRWSAALIWVVIFVASAVFTGGWIGLLYYVAGWVHFIVVLCRGQKAIDAKYNYGK